MIPQAFLQFRLEYACGDCCAGSSSQSVASHNSGVSHHGFTSGIYRLLEEKTLAGS